VLERVATPSFAEQQLAAIADLRGPIQRMATQPRELTALSRAVATRTWRPSNAPSRREMPMDLDAFLAELDAGRSVSF